MKTLEHILSGSLIESLGWTILHSIWQGAILALLLVITLIGLRRNSSKVRYFVSVSALFTMFLISFITFLVIYPEAVSKEKIHKEQMQALEAVNGTKIIIEADTHIEVSENADTADYLSFFSDYFEAHLPLIVALWLVGVITLMLRFLGGFAYLQRLKHYRTQKAPDFWQGTTNFLASQIKLRKPVILLESAVAKVPMVIGFFKPVILLPIGTLTGLSQSQVESILAHELAHIKRNDYLVNLLQSLVEIALFFNPFIWWISACVREERENCCDDIAVSLTEDHITFVKTLATLEEMRLQSPELAVAFAGRGGLLGRVKRLLNRDNPTATFSEGFLSALVLLFCLGIASLNAHTNYSISNGIASVVNPFSAYSPINLVQTGVNNAIEQIFPNEEVKISKAEKADKLAEISQIDEEAQASSLIGKDDTIRLSGGLMFVTDARGNVQIFKDGQKISQQDYEKYKDVFEYKAGDKKVNRNINRDVFIFDNEKFNKDFNQNFSKSWNVITIPEIPEIPEIPAIPDVPEIPNFNGRGIHKSLRIYVKPNGDDITELWIDGEKLTKKEWKKYDDVIIQWKRKGKKGKSKDGSYTIVIPDSNYEQQWEQWGENFGKSWEKWGENFGKMFEDKFSPKTQDLDRQLEQLERQKERLEEQKILQEERLEEQKILQEERRLEIEARRTEMEARRADMEEKRKIKRQAMKEIFDVLEEDGLIEKGKRKSIKIKSQSPKAKIEINGKELTDEQYQKYKPLFEKLWNVNLEKEGSNFNWVDDGDDDE